MSIGGIVTTISRNRVNEGSEQEAPKRGWKMSFSCIASRKPLRSSALGTKVVDFNPQLNGFHELFHGPNSGARKRAVAGLSIIERRIRTTSSVRLGPSVWKGDVWERRKKGSRRWKVGVHTREDVERVRSKVGRRHFRSNHQDWKLRRKGRW